MRFLHCADLHLDSPLRGLARREGAPAESLRGATRSAFERLVDVAVEQAVGAVVVAGDLYDGDRDDYQTAVFLQRQLHRLREAGIPVVLAYGNHDAESEITRRLRLPERAHALPSSAAGSVVLEEAGLAVHGRSYATRVVDDDLTTSYPGPVPGLLNVGVLHTALEGRPGHARYAPCTLDGLVRRGYGYWALGHVHQREELVRDGVRIVFPGNLCGRHVGETGGKGATLVEHDGDVVMATTHLDLAPVRWHRLVIDAPEVGSVSELTEAVVGALEPVRREAPSALHAVRLLAHVTAEVDQEWRRHAEQCEAQLRADAAGADEAVWLERVELRARAGRGPVAGEAMAAIADTLTSLRASANGRREVTGLLAPVRARFGAELGPAAELDGLGLDDEALELLFDDAGALLAAELAGGE